jgi:hypothetical protein
MPTQHGAVLVIGAQAVGGAGDVERLVAGRDGDDVEQHHQLVVEFFGGAVDQRGLLREQDFGEVGLHPLRLDDGHQGDHQDRRDAGCKCNLGLYPRWLHFVLAGVLRELPNAY